MIAVRIAGMGAYLPKNKVSSSSLDERCGLPLGSFEAKSGLVSRHFVSAQETSSFMGAQAAREAVRHAGLELSDIDLIIAASGAPEQALPVTSVLIQKQLGLEQSGIPCFDLNSTCLSFLTALDTASYLIHGGRYKRVLIVSSDITSVGLNWKDMETCSIFGDGAAACVLEPSNGSSRILSSFFETHSIGADYCRIEAGGTKRPPLLPLDYPEQAYFHMEGKKVFKLAAQLIKNTTQKLFEQAGVTLADISWVVPHQANLLAMSHVRKFLNIPKEKFVDIFATHGNQMAASIPTALNHLIQSGSIQRGQLIYILGTGAGISAAGMILEY